MAKRNAEPTKAPRARAFLVGVEIYQSGDLLSLSDSLRELTLLADTAGLEVVGQVTQKLDHPNPNTFIGPGKVEEVRTLVEETRADVVIFDEELSPRHLRELEQIFGTKIQILDRTALILDIFAQHAHTREGALQVELAQYEYRLPRLTRAWTHLARQAGGGGGRSGGVGGVGLRGPGETQLEVDRRDIRRRIDHLKKELEKVRIHRQQYRRRRKRSRVPVVALVGYTNAGKSTLLNRLTAANVYVADQLFATLDPTTRRVELPGGYVALFTDTVGFIQKLPTALIAAFRATLEEIAEADLLLHLVDITHPNARAQAEAVEQTLAEIEADHIPVITVLNKIDQLLDPDRARVVLEHFSNAVAISALAGDGIDDLLDTVGKTLFETYIPASVLLPFDQGNLISLFHEAGQVERTEHERNGVFIQGRLPGRLIALYRPYSRVESAVDASSVKLSKDRAYPDGMIQQQEGIMIDNESTSFPVDQDDEPFDETDTDEDFDDEELDDIDLEEAADEDSFEDEDLEDDLEEEDLEIDEEDLEEDLFDDDEDLEDDDFDIDDEDLDLDEDDDEDFDDEDD